MTKDDVASPKAKKVAAAVSPKKRPAIAAVSPKKVAEAGSPKKKRNCEYARILKARVEAAEKFSSSEDSDTS